MVDLVVGQTLIRAQGGAKIKLAVAGGTITPGQPIAVSPTEFGKRIIQADKDLVLRTKVLGISLHPSRDGQPLRYQTAGDIDLGTTLSVGKHYILGAQGGIRPIDDLVAGEYPRYIGYAISTSIMRLNLSRSSEVVAAAADIT